MADKDTVKRLEKAALDVKLSLLKLCNQTVIHIGGDMSIAEMMTVVWQYAMKYDIANPRREERDRFVLSKGHAAAVTSFSQAAIGCYSNDDIYNEYATDYGRFGMHSCNLVNPYVDVSTGSLGHGLPVGAGIATALKAKGLKNSRVFVGMGDGELCEGTMWEAAMLASHYKLGNLVGFVDKNGLSFDGETEKVMSLEPLSDKWRAFGWRVVEVDGHDMAQLVDVIDDLPPASSNVPTVIIGNTVKGNGISFMAGSAAWHAGSLNDEKYNAAVNEVKATYSKKWGEIE